MAQKLIYLAAIITVAYCDCCTESDISFEEKCSGSMTVDCHVKHYGIYCCDTRVQRAIKRFATDSDKLVKLNHKPYLLYIYNIYIVCIPSYIYCMYG